MLTRTKKRVVLIAPLAVVAVVLSACGSSKKAATTGTTPSGSAAASGGIGVWAPQKVQQGGSMVATVEKDPSDFNITTSQGNTFDTAQYMNGIFPAVFQVDQNINVFLNNELMDSATLTSQSPETVVYKIKANAVWSDGVPINADDFIYTNQVQNGKNTKYTPASTTGYEDVASVTGSDNGKTVTVVFAKPFADWKSLFGYLLPAHYMKTLNADPVKAYNEGMLAPHYPKVSGGPYVITDYKSNDHVTLARNAKYYGPLTPLDTLTFKIITDSTQEPTALQNNEVNYIYPQPEIDLIKQVDQIPNVTTNVGFGLVFEHFDLNLGNKFLKDKALRQAIFTATDVPGIVAATVKQFSDKSQPLGNRMLVQGQPGYQDNSGTYGKADVAGAKAILQKAGYTGIGTALTTPDGTKVAPLRFRYTTGNQIRQQEGELLKETLAQLGVTLNIVPTDDLGGTLSKKDFDVIVFAWVGTPFPFSANKALYVTNGDSNYDNYSNPVVDQALGDAAQQLDTQKAIADLNTADKQLYDDAVTLPLYQKATYLAYDKKFGNIENNSTSVGPTWNVGHWGIL